MKAPSPVRWSEDLGWLLRCPCCPDGRGTRYWPLTFEFWNPRNMARCRACTAELKRAYERKHATKRARYQREYRAIAKDLARITNAAYYESHKAEALEYNRRWKTANRDRVNAAARARYQRKNRPLSEEAA